MTKYDAIILGSGQGGTPIAYKLADLGWKVALIEKEHLGGSCINYGCTPTKTMIAVLEGQYLAQPGDVVSQCGHRKLGCGDGVAVGLQALDDGAPAGAVGPRAVNKNDVRSSIHFSGSFLVLRRLILEATQYG